MKSIQSKTRERIIKINRTEKQNESSEGEENKRKKKVNREKVNQVRKSVISFNEDGESLKMEAFLK